MKEKWGNKWGKQKGKLRKMRKQMGKRMRMGMKGMGMAGAGKGMKDFGMGGMQSEDGGPMGAMMAMMAKKGGKGGRGGMGKMMMKMMKMKEMKAKWAEVSDEDKQKMKCIKWRKGQKKAQAMCDKMEEFGKGILTYYSENAERFAEEFDGVASPEDMANIRTWGDAKLAECRLMATCKTNVVPAKMQCMRGFKQLTRKYSVNMERAEAKVDDDELPSNEEVS